MSKQNQSFGVDHLAQLPVTVMFAVVIVIAMLGLALLRHFSLSVDA